MIIALCYAVGILAGVSTLWIFHKATPAGQSLGCGAFLTAFAVFFVTAILAGTAFDSMIAPAKFEAAPADASALHQLKAEAQARLAVLRKSKDEGRLLDRVALSVSQEGENLKMHLQNRSSYPLTVTKVEVVNSTAWEKYLNERYNGILVKDMPRQMRPEWLKQTGYWTTYNRIRGETHRQFVIATSVLPMAEIAHSEPLPPGFRNAVGLKSRVFEVQDASGKQWCSMAELDELEFMARM